MEIKSDFTVNGQDFSVWFNTWISTNATANGLFRSTYSKNYPPAPIVQDQFAEIFNRIALFTGKDAINENEFAAYFCIFYNETGGRLYPISEFGGRTLEAESAYFFEAGTGAMSWKASYNGILGNRKAGDLLKARGVISSQDDVDAWNSTTHYPHNAPADVKEKAKDTDFYKYRGRGIIQTTGRDNYMTTVQPLTDENLDNLTEDEMHALFQRFSVYLGAVRLFYDVPSRQQARNDVANGQFKKFGQVTAGNNPAYLEEFEARAKLLSEALRNANVQNKGTQAVL